MNVGLPADGGSVAEHRCDRLDRPTRLLLCLSRAGRGANLAQRGYRPKEWQLVSTRRVAEAPLGRAQPKLTVRRAQPGQEELYCRVILAGALYPAKSRPLTLDPSAQQEWQSSS